jgi:signal transduction histidine kinase
VITNTSLFFENLKRRLPSTDAQSDKARLEAFLAAYPGEYCGFGDDGTLAFSPNFPQLFGRDTIRHLTDVQNALTLADAAALEHAILRLDYNQPFTLKVQTQDTQAYLRLSGSKGVASDGRQAYLILWAENITADEKIILEERHQLSEAERKTTLLHCAFDALDDAVWMRNIRGKVTWRNAVAQKLLTENDDMGFSKKPGQKNIAEIESECLSTGLTRDDERNIIVNGERKTFRVSITPLPQFDIVISRARDVTADDIKNRNTERNLAANRELLENLHTAIAIFGADQKLEFFNTAYAQLWHLDDQWLNTRPKLGDILERLREQRRLPEQADFKRYKQSWLDQFTTLLKPHEDMIYLPDGASLRSLVMPHPLGGLMMLFEDVTSRLALESSYNTLVAVQKETLDNLAEGVAAFGGDGRLKLYNPAFARLWTLNPEDVDGEPHITRVVERMKIHFAPEEWSSARENLLAQALERSPRDGQIIRKDQSVLEFAAVPLPDGGMLVTHIDITDSIRVENALREKTTALETAERLKLDFLANVSYQLRTPLNAIIGFTDILHNEYFGTLTPKQKEYTQGLSEAGARLMTLINDILDLSTIEAGYLALEKTEIEVYDLLKGLHDLTLEWARRGRVEMKLACANPCGILHADERRMKQILLNLIRNAIDFTPAGGTITLQAEKTAHEIVLSVADTGPGIAIEDQERIFRPFEKTNEARDDGDGNGRGGAGLGLTLVRTITELHGGRLTLESIKGQGSKFSIHLPI